MYYKTVTPDGRGIYSGWQWPTQVGESTPALDGAPIECDRGYHLCRAEDLGRWPGQLVLQVDTVGPIVVYRDKVATCAPIRVVRRGTLEVGAYADWCAERAKAAAYATYAAADAAERQEQSRWILEHIQWEDVCRK